MHLAAGASQTSEKSERDLPTSERENNSWVAVIFLLSL